MLQNLQHKKELGWKSKIHLSPIFYILNVHKIAWKNTMEQMANGDVKWRQKANINIKYMNVCVLWEICICYFRSKQIRIQMQIQVLDHVFKDETLSIEYHKNREVENKSLS